MGEHTSMKVYRAPSRPIYGALPEGLYRRKPRSYREWSALRRWGRLPAWEIEPTGYLLRWAREAGGLAQRDLAERLDCSQQAIAQAERWQSNPSVEFLRKWAAACGGNFKLELSLSSASQERSKM